MNVVCQDGNIYYSNPQSPDSDGDGLLDGEEIVCDIDKAVHYNYGLKKDETTYYSVSFTMYSDPMEADTDGDGISDYNETNRVTYESPNGPKYEYDGDPLNKGLAGDITGELIIISYNEPDYPDGGHSFLIYQSYIIDELDFTNFEAGYVYNIADSDDKWLSVSPRKYSISPGEYITIGNFNYGGDGGSGSSGFIGGSSGSESSGNGSSSGSSGASSSGSSNTDSSSGSSNSNCNSATSGVHFNIEFNVIYDEGKDYNDNKAISRSITAEQLHVVIEYFSKHNWYHLLTNNCAELASTAWNKAFNDDIDAKTIVWLPSKLKESISDREDSYTINFDDASWKERFNQ